MSRGGVGGTPLLAHARALKHWFLGEREVRLLHLLCDPGRSALDVGAHKGAYAYFLRRYASACHAYEPNPVLADGLEKTFPDVTVHRVALSDTEGWVDLRLPKDGAPGLATIEAGNDLDGRPTRTIRVRRTSLDNMADVRPGLIKIDAEGHELAILRGAAATLRRWSPNLLVELEDRHRRDAVATVRRFLSDLGYAGFFIAHERLFPIAAFEGLRHRPHSDHRPVAGANNFIFSADEETIVRLQGRF